MCENSEECYIQIKINNTDKEQKRKLNMQYSLHKRNTILNNTIFVLQNVFSYTPLNRMTKLNDEIFLS